MTLRDVLNQPLEEEPSKLDRQSAIKVISMIIHRNKSTMYAVNWWKGKDKNKMQKKRFLNIYLTANQFDESHNLSNSVQCVFKAHHLTTKSGDIKDSTGIECDVSQQIVDEMRL